MKKSIVTPKLKLNGETVKRLGSQQLTAIIGGVPAPTFLVACPAHTARDCE